MGDIWNPQSVIIASPSGPYKVEAYVHRGLALRHHGWATPRSQTLWSLVHIGSGATVVLMRGSVTTVMPVGFAIAECGDWTLFDLPTGWRQTDPELFDRVGVILIAHPEVFPHFPETDVTEEEARAAIEMREDCTDA